MIIANLRMRNYGHFFSIHLDKDHLSLSRTSKPIFEGSTETVLYADRERTIADHPTLMDGAKYDQAVKDFEGTDKHGENIQVMRGAAKTAFEGCV